ncbi:MAG: hypothetical protein V4581_07325 [Bacteroidota bacterium]
MKKLLIALLLFPLLSFAQDITGKWKKQNETDVAMEFKGDGTLSLISLRNPGEPVLRNLELKYRLFKENDQDRMEIEMLYDGKSVEKRVNAYALKDGKLYLPSVIETNGVETVSDKLDEYIRIE